MSVPNVAEPCVKTIRLRYFALLREHTHRDFEVRNTTSRKCVELYKELQLEYEFPLPPSRIKVAVNGEFVDLEHPLQAGDEVVFIPPVAGG